MSTNQMVTCDRHPGHHTCLLVCRHVIAGATVAHYMRPSVEEIGEALCALCDDELNRLPLQDQNERNPTIAAMKLVCNNCFAKFARFPAA